MRPASFFLTAYCRMVQLCVRLVYLFLRFPTPETIHAPNALERLAARIAQDGARRPLLVTGHTIRRLGLHAPFCDALMARGIEPTLFSDIAQNPNDQNVEAGVLLYREQACDALIAFGGGGPMDCAKAIGARLVRPNRPICALHGFLRVGRKLPPFYCVPTTAGSGSETTIAAVIVDQKSQRKASIGDPTLVPLAAALDPALTVGLPPRVTAETGLDALCHAIEAYTNGRYCTASENEAAREAVRLIHQNLLPACENGNDLAAREGMQRAAFLAGRAFTRGGVGYVHAIGHALGGLYGISHGTAMGILLPHVLRAYGSAVDQKLGELARVCGFMGDSERQRAHALIEWIERVKRKTGVPERAACIRCADIPKLAAWAAREANPIYPVPVVWDQARIGALLESVCELDKA